MLLIKTKESLIQSLIGGAWTFPGCYPKYYVTKDCSCLCYKCLAPRKVLGGKALFINPRAIDAIENPNSDTEWEVIGVDVNYENPSLYCDECSKRIESAYAEPEKE
jgi:hypothetical protein